MRLSEWRRGLFQPEIVHVQDPASPIHVGPTVRWADSLCGRRVHVNSAEGIDTLRCPDCARLAEM